MITLGDAIKAINPNAEFEYDDIDNIIWRKKTKPINKEEILAKYRELKDIDLERVALEKAAKLSVVGNFLRYLDNNKIIVFKYRQALATSSIIVS